MKKLICTAFCIILCTGIFAGCGSAPDAEDCMVYVDKKGVVTSVDVEALDQDYYDVSELKSYVEDTVAQYTAEHGKNTVKVSDFSVKDGMAKLKMKYQTPEDYTRFNGIELYQGKVVKALAAGYDFNVDFAAVEDGQITQSASREEIYAQKDLKAVIIKANMDVKIDGTICFVSSENVKVTGNDSVSIREGYTGTPQVESTEMQGTEAQTGAAWMPEDGSFETDVYTYIIYK